MTSQRKQHQVKPTEFGKYGDDDNELAINIYQTPFISSIPKPVQYCKKAKIFDKFVQ